MSAATCETGTRARAKAQRRAEAAPRAQDPEAARFMRELSRLPPEAQAKALAFLQELAKQQGQSRLAGGSQ